MVEVQPVLKKFLHPRKIRASFEILFTIGAPQIQQFIGALANRNANKGVFITTSNFTDASRNALQGPYRVILVDGELLSRLMIDYNIGVATKVSYDVKEIDTDYFSEE